MTANTQYKTVSELSVTTTVSANDRVVILYNPATTANVKTVTLSNMAANLIFSNSVPANSTATGYKGQIRFDSNYVYVCTDVNTWKRAALSSW